MRSSLVFKTPQTPAAVLDVTCLSYTSAETTACSGSNSQSCEPIKRFQMLMWKVDFSIFTSLSDSKNLRMIEVDHKVQYNDRVDQVRHETLLGSPGKMYKKMKQDPQRGPSVE
ncbi:hypothetical protein HPP92_006250 [Vanilla planifolia]|uniref:Uncharacterized protein n=1 Tax=Vanilla planifolia TaxID=51239 RepID=A0A835RV82_VANPL|nr:hypothetical protein HPP92_006250 [Vanilla planifolia]